MSTKTSNLITLQEYIDRHGSSVLLDGLVFHIPAQHVGKYKVPQRRMALLSAWGMGDGRVGIWWQTPETYPNGQTWPLTNLQWSRVLKWKIENPR